MAPPARLAFASGHVAPLARLALASGFVMPLAGLALPDRPPADGMAAGEDVALADDEGVPEGVALGDCVTGGSGITGLVGLWYRACWPAAGDEGAGEEGAGEEGAGEEGAGDDGAVEGTLDAPADVDPGTGVLHTVTLVPA